MGGYDHKPNDALVIHRRAERGSEESTCGRCSESNNSYLLLSGGADGKNEFISKEAVKLSHRHGNYAILCLCKSKGICKLDFMEVKDGKRMFA